MCIFHLIFLYQVLKKSSPLFIAINEAPNNTSSTYQYIYMQNNSLGIVQRSMKPNMLLPTRGNICLLFSVCSGVNRLVGSLLLL